MKRFLLAALLVDFVALTVYALYASGLSGAIELYALGEVWTYQLTADFLIALGISVAWMIGHARARGVSWVPYLILTLLLGSIGPLSYVVIHAMRRPAKQPANVAKLAPSRAAA